MSGAIDRHVQRPVVFHAHAGLPREELMARLHDALRPISGAALAVAEIITGRQVVLYFAVGNIVARSLPDGPERNVVSHFGTLGHDVRRIQAFQYPWPPRATLVLHSDGLTGRWALEDYPGLAVRDPLLIAGVLYRDHARENDDCTVVVVRGRKRCISSLSTLRKRNSSSGATNNAATKMTLGAISASMVSPCRRCERTTSRFSATPSVMV